MSATATRLLLARDPVLWWHFDAIGAPDGDGA